jgi:hypothetical protein
MSGRLPVSISPADPQAMNPGTVPYWWKDIRRSRETALRDCERVLGSIRTLLSEPVNLDRRAIQTDLNLWTALLHAACRAGDAIRASAGLAESRRVDVTASGLVPPEDTDLAERGLRLSREITILSGEIKNRLKLLSEQLSGRRRRPKFPGSYRSHYPSQIDVHV